MSKADGKVSKEIASFLYGEKISGGLCIHGSINIGGAPLPDPRVSINSRNDAGFNAFILKAADDSPDANMEGGASVHHGRSYNLTPGYAMVFQVYSLAGGAALALGCNSYEGFAGGGSPYKPPEDCRANGSVRIETGPYWPASERARWNNGGDYLHAGKVLATAVLKQDGDLVTGPAGTFNPNIVGEFVAWGDRMEGGWSFVDRIVFFLSDTQVRVERARQIAPQSARIVTYGAAIMACGSIRLTDSDLTLRQSPRGATESAWVRHYARQAASEGGHAALLVASDGGHAIELPPRHFILWEMSLAAETADAAGGFAGVRRFVTRGLPDQLMIGEIQNTGEDFHYGSGNGFKPEISISGHAGKLRIELSADVPARIHWSASLKAVAVSMHAAVPGVPAG